MKEPDIPPNETERQAALCALELLDTAPEERFDRITRIAQRHFGVQIALVSLVDAGRQWFKSRQGLDAAETPRDISFCGHAILADDIFHIPNALKDPRFADNPLVTGGPEIRFYAGAPLHAPGGERVGTLCVIDSQPRELNAEDLAMLRDLGDSVEAELEHAQLRETEIHMRSAQDRLHEKEHLLSESQRIAHMGSWLYDLKGQLSWSDELYRVYGVSPDTFVPNAESFLNLIHPDDRPVMQRWLEACAAGEKPGDLEFRTILPDGGVRFIAGRGELERDAENRPIHIAGTAQDITARKHAEQALIAARDAAEQANRAKDSFLATMSHEIRTPLGGLIGMLELLSLSPLNSEQGETLQTARDSGQSLLRILNDILDWSKIEDGMLELAPRATSIRQLVAEVANTYARVASANSIVLTQQLDARLSPAIMVDPLRLSQVLNNFVSNAIKFSPRGTPVELRADLIERREGAEEVRFSVHDTGIGIDPDMQQRLFQSYGQGSADTARMYGGTGLGLAICRRLADMMDARIDLDSAPGRGSTFSITLTLAITKTLVEPKQSPAEIIAAVSARPLVDGVAAAGAPLVLVVDDQPTNRKLLVLQLGLLGLRAETAEDGAAALSLWRDGHYALVITDCHMPVMDGYALTRAIRGIEIAEARPRTPIFAWTANALADEIENCRAAGMDELLVKPADLAQLKWVLETWLPIATEPLPELAAAAEPQAAAPLAVDVNVLKARVGDDAAVVREFLLDFRTSSATIVAELRATCGRDQAKAAGAAAHKLKSAARAVGALALGERCVEMEQAGKADDSETLAVLLPRLEQELVAVEGCLDWLLQDRPQIAKRSEETVAVEKSTLRILVLDDEPSMLKLLAHMLARQGYTQVTTCDSGHRALDLIAGPNTATDLVLCDLNMPEMDGIEFVRKLVERRYTGSLILVSGEDERVLQTAEKLVQAHSITLLGRLGKPPTPEGLAALLGKWSPPSKTKFRMGKKRYGADEVRTAISAGELVNYYQPKVALATGEVVGMETLVRWRHPVDGMVFPDEFITVAEAHGLIDDLTRVVLAGALAQAKAWHAAGLSLSVAINVSMDSLASLDFPDFVAAQAAAAGVAAQHVVLEVTESRLMHDSLASLEILTRLRLKRFGVAIDDFGTGHSSLAQLRDIPFDELKVDRSFVHGAHADETARAIYEASLGLAKQLNMNIVAEGVEDQADWDFLCRTGCQLAQGYFIAKPMAAADLPGWMADWQARVRGGFPVKD